MQTSARKGEVMMTNKELAERLVERGIINLHYESDMEAFQAVIAALRASARMEWLEGKSTLHTSVEILYVVDGYEVVVLHEDGVTEVSPRFHGETLAAAIDKAIAHDAQSAASNGLKEGQ
jgi:hypothetical protein